MKNLVLALSLLLAAQNSFAGPGKKDGHHQKGEQLRKELGLSEEQLVKIKEIRRERKSSIQEKRQAAKIANQAFRAALANSQSSKDEIAEKYRAMSQARQAIRDARFETMLEVRNVLNEQQRTKFHAMRDKWKGHSKSKGSKKV